MLPGGNKGGKITSTELKNKDRGAATTLKREPYLWVKRGRGGSLGGEGIGSLVEKKQVDKFPRTCAKEGEDEAVVLRAGFERVEGTCSKMEPRRSGQRLYSKVIS